jgi:hypothetical protein
MNFDKINQDNSTLDNKIRDMGSKHIISPNILIGHINNNDNNEPHIINAQKHNIYTSQAGQDIFILNILNCKSDGVFVEIGAHHPFCISNTYVLEKHYNWKGIMIEYDKSFLPLYIEHRPKSIHVINDATTIDYKHLFEINNMPLEIDYLQIDLEVNNRSTLTTLELLDAQVFDNYKFATITFEHDIYTGDFYNTREKSREILTKRGYICVFKDICESGPDVVFEDWYVHPDLVDMNYINLLMNNNRKNYIKNSITGESINHYDIVY